MTDLVKLPTPEIFPSQRIPEPLTGEQRKWLVAQLHSWPKRVNEARTCAIGPLTDMATAEFCRVMDEIERLRGALREARGALVQTQRTVFEVAGYNPAEIDAAMEDFESGSPTFRTIDAALEEQP